MSNGKAIICRQRDITTPLSLILWSWPIRASMYAGTNNAGWKGKKDGKYCVRSVPGWTILTLSPTNVWIRWKNTVLSQPVRSSMNFHRNGNWWSVPVSTWVSIPAKWSVLMVWRISPKDITSNKMYSATKTIRTFYLPTGTNWATVSIWVYR